MNIEWKYRIELKEGAISAIENKYGITIPKDLQQLLEVANAATPSVTKFMVKVDEKLLGAILSFNPDEKEADSFESAMQMNFDKGIVPFGIDPFGNYICYDTSSGRIVFYDHEEDTMIGVADSLEEYLNGLY